VASPALLADKRRHEVADILRDHAHGLNLTQEQARAVRDITACRTVRLGGHLEVCQNCGFSRGSYNSCRNRHCPKCQILKQELWAEAQEALLLPTAYFQVVFTIPTELHRLFKRAPKVCLGLLFDAVAQTLAEVATTKLKATIGFTAVLHTWNQKLGFHPHLHCIVPGGGLSLDKSRWVPTSRGFFLPVNALRQVFRGKLLAKLEQTIRAADLPGDLAQNLGHLRSTPKTWNVYAKRPLAGPGHVVRYLSRYVHRIAIANSRITDYDGETVTFRYTDRADGGRTKTRTVAAPKFAQLFLQHVLPPQFVRIRHYGLLSLRRRKDLARCRELVGAAPAVPSPKDASWVAAFERLFGTNPLACPACKTGLMVIREVLPPMRR
jgi:Putative transposase/Transposase zinc-binding domain